MFPPIVFSMTVSIPSPPSAMGMISVEHLGKCFWISSAMALPASVEVRLPLNESIAITAFMLVGLEDGIKVMNNLFYGLK